MMNRIALHLLPALILWQAAGPAAADERIQKALADGKVHVDLRYRFEWVDEDGSAENAEASTLRLRLGYTTGTYRGIFAHADFEALGVIGSERYNSTANDLTEFPIVADPEDEEINQAYLGYSGLPNTTFRLGRQRITLDNHRFIGNVGWRQNEQTFDAFSAKTKIGKKVDVFYAHLNNANRVFGEHHPNAASADTNLRSDLLNVAYRLPPGTLIGYAYVLEVEDDPASSHKDLGVRFSGKHVFKDQLALLYTAEYAEQSDYDEGASFIDADYGLGEVGVMIHGVTLKLSYERLEGDGTYAFQTPLATLHAFNGWVDKFLATPATGLEDWYVSAETTLKGIRLLGVYHDFGADAGGEAYGTELDLLISRSFKEIYSASLKYGRYDADTFSTDTDKLWATLQVKF